MSVTGTIKELYGDTHAYGRFVAVGIFMTHGVLDYLTTIMAYFMAKSRGVPFHNVETNDLLASAGNPVEIGAIIIGSAFLISMLPMVMYAIIRKVDDADSINRLFADGLFTILLLGGIWIVINNAMFLLTF